MENKNEPSVSDTEDRFENEEASFSLVHSSANISSTELDEETAKKLRGDAIGNSLYSQSFVLKTLMQFSNVEWNEQFEEDLCFLWDMTLDKDVCEFLFKMSYPSIVCSAITNCRENRFIEIVVGILGNMFCAKCEKSISPDEITLLLNIINTDDPLILIQVMRFITAISSAFEDLNFLTQDILERIDFILVNSTNDELLMRTLETVVKITTDFKLCVDKINGDLINSCFIAYRTLFYDHKSKEAGLSKNIVQFMCNVCGYMTNFEDLRLHNEIKKYSSIFTDEIAKLLQYYSIEKHLFPLTDEFDFYAEATSFLIVILTLGYCSNIFVSIFKIIILLLKHECPVPKSLLDIITFLISKGNIHDIKHDLKRFKITDVNRVFSFLDEEEYDCEYSYKENFTSLKIDFH